MELEEQSGVNTCKGDSEKICWPLVQAGEDMQRKDVAVKGERLLQVVRVLFQRRCLSKRRKIFFKGGKLRRITRERGVRA